MSENQYLILLDIDVRKRHSHVTEAGKVTKFVVQLEIKLGEEWKEVIMIVPMIMDIKIVIILRDNVER